MERIPADNAAPSRLWVVTNAGLALKTEAWDDYYIAYQFSSAETHAFNETTVLILKSLEQGPMSIQMLRSRTELALGLLQGDLAPEGFEFATARLEELGLIERLDSASTIR